MVAWIRAALLAYGLALANAGAAQPQPGQPEADPTQEVSARLAFDRGLGLLRDQRWDEAEVEFRASLAAMPRASAQYNLALVVFKQGRLRESIAMLQQLLNTSGGAAPDPRYREAATELLSEALAGLGVLHLSVLPATAEMRIDGELAAVGGAERSLPIDPGHHHVEVSASGFIATQFDFDAVPQVEEQRKVELRLASLSHASGMHEPVAAAPAASPRASLGQYAPWLIAGIGGALLVSSLVIGAIAKNDDGEFSQQCPTHRGCDPSLKPKRDRIARLGMASDVLLVSGAIAGAGGLGWALIAGASTHAESRGVALRAVACARF